MDFKYQAILYITVFLGIAGLIGILWDVNNQPNYRDWCAQGYVPVEDRDRKVVCIQGYYPMCSEDVPCQ
jgi:hypothetical protein